MMEKYGIHFIHASDEWYILADRELPVRMNMMDIFSWRMVLECSTSGNGSKRNAEGLSGDDRKVTGRIVATGKLAAPLCTVYKRNPEEISNVQIKVTCSQE